MFKFIRVMTFGVKDLLNIMLVALGILQLITGKPVKLKMRMCKKNYPQHDSLHQMDHINMSLCLLTMFTVSAHLLRLAEPR